MKVHQGVTVPSLMWKGFLPMRRQRSKTVIRNFCVLCFFSCTHVVGCGGGDVCGSVIEHQTCDRKIAGLIPTQETGIKWRNVWV